MRILISYYHFILTFVFSSNTISHSYLIIWMERSVAKKFFGNDPPTAANYPDYYAVINVSKVITVVIAPQARPKIWFLTTSNTILSITHSNSFNYIDYC